MVISRSPGSLRIWVFEWEHRLLGFKGFLQWPRPFPFRSLLLRYLLPLLLASLILVRLFVFVPKNVLLFWGKGITNGPIILSLALSHSYFVLWWVWVVQVGTYFVGQYYHVLQHQPEFVHQFYSDASTMIRIDGNARETATAMLVNFCLFFDFG